MRERPILFSAPMVRAILAGTKTQTRRIVKPEPLHVTTFVGRDGAPTNEFGMHFQTDRVIERHARCPYGSPGDRLWVRETWGLLDTQPKDGPERATVFYRATDETRRDLRYQLWRPSIFMPRWASRITLEVVSVRVERLHEIDELDALAEGVAGKEVDGVLDGKPGKYTVGQARDAYAELWDKINGERAPWSSNPWVWRVEFRTTTPRLGDGDGEGGV